VTLYGTEAMHVLRAEKGYIIVGQETDGTVTPFDLGMDWIVAQKKGDFIGKRGLARPDLAAPNRRQLVGLLTEDPNLVLEEGAQLVERPDAAIPCPMVGHVTSSYLSPAAGRSIALALVAGGHGRQGQTLYVPMPSDRIIQVEVTRPVFYDPEGTRLHG
jgi:sarcosine oxidase, subunit alpha